MSQLPFVASLVTSPLPWVIVVGLFAGGALSRATRRTRGAEDPDHASTGKWVMVCLSLSAAVIFGILAVFVPGPPRILNPAYGWAAGISAAAGFLALRFRKTVGIPVVVLVIALVVVIALFLQSVRAFTGETEIASLRVIFADSAAMRLELVPRGEQPVLLSMKGNYFAPIVKVVIFNDLFVFLGARTWYRFVGMTSFDEKNRQQDLFNLARPIGISERLWMLFEEYETSIPGVKTVQTDFASKKTKEFASYGIMSGPAQMPRRAASPTVTVSSGPGIKAPDRATMKEVEANPANIQGFMIFLFFPSTCKYNRKRSAISFQPSAF